MKRPDRKQLFYIKKLMFKYNLTEKQVLEIIESPFIFIKQKIQEININEIKTEEEFNNKTKNFNIPYIGKLYANYYNFKKYKKHEENGYKTNTGKTK